MESITSIKVPGISEKGTRPLAISQAVTAKLYMSDFSL